MTNSEENKFDVITLIAEAQAANDKLRKLIDKLRKLIGELQKLIGELRAYQTLEAQVWQQIIATEDCKPVFIREVSGYEVYTDELNLEDELGEVAQSWGSWKGHAAVVLRFENTEKKLSSNLYYVHKTEKNQGLLEAQRMAANGTRAVMQQFFSTLKKAEQARDEALFMFNDICIDKNKAAFAEC